MPYIRGALVSRGRLVCRGRVKGGVPERLKGTGCKPVGYAYVGSNPTPSTTQDAQTMARRNAENKEEARFHTAGVAQW